MASASGPDGRLQEFSDDDPSELTRMPGIVLVEFWADWCSPCHAMRPELETYAAEAPDDVRVVAVEVTAYPDTAQHFGVSAVPSLIVLSNGVEVARSTGAKRRSQIERFVEGARR